jgi:hypothetical protein
MTSIHIDQSIINRLASQHEPRTKHNSTGRLVREAQYQASNDEIKGLELENSDHD